MPVHWLLDANVFDTYHDELVAAIERAGHIVRSINPPSPPYGWDDTPDAYRKLFPRGACVVTHADIDLVQRVQADRRWTPGAIATVEHFYCSRYYPHLERFLLNRDYETLPFADLKSRTDLFDTLGSEGKVFVAPDSPLKLFTGMVACRESWDRDVEFMGFYEFPPESPVIVSWPKNIASEWRFVVAKQAVVAGSQYRRGDKLIAEPCRDDQARAFAEQVLAAGYTPDPVWVMDICRTSDGAYHLLEIGGFSFANLYACDKDAVAQSVSNVAAEMHARREPS